MARLEDIPVFLLEDEAAVLDHIVAMLDDLGCHIVGPASTFESATSLLRSDAPHVGLLELKIEGKPSYSVADQMRVYGIPFAFITANANAIEPPYDQFPVLAKPFSKTELREMIIGLLEGRHHRDDWR